MTVSLSVCVVLYHTDPSLVTRCLDSIRASACAAQLKAEIVVVDNSSTDMLRAQFEPGVDRWIQAGNNLGFGRASNMALAASAGDHVLFLNPDAELSSAAVAEFFAVSQAAEDDRTLFCGWLTNGGEVQVDAFMHWWFSTGRLLRRRHYRSYLEQSARQQAAVAVQKVSGGALFARRDSLVSLGPFDERFFLYGEDADLSQRAIKAGIKLFALPRAVVAHVGASSQATFSPLVERARTDAAVRVSSYHLNHMMSLATRLDLLLVTLVGMLPGAGASSATKRSRLARVGELRRWGLSRERAPFDPSAERPRLSKSG